jgi:microcystin-dependent protein
MADPFVGELRVMAFSYAPAGWVPCDGRLLSVSQFTPLYAVIGSLYGGNGTTTFAVPDLRGSATIGQGQGTGLTNYVVGETAGATTVTLTLNELPAHTHVPDAKVNQSGTANMHNVPVTGDQMSRFAPSGGIGSAYNNPPLNNPATFAPTMVQPTGNGAAHSNQQPYLSMMYCIATQGVFPARN